jgi:3-phosphoshikimate 1-carboxyvinyltransferase
MAIPISHPNQNLKGEILLTTSKSLSNRALIIQALCNEGVEINNLATANDTNVLQQLLNSQEKELSVGIAGTAMRFLTAFLAIKDNNEIILTGDNRMKERPIKVLVNVLKDLGAGIEYLENDGYPPLKITGKTLDGGKIVIDGSVSSQYISALLMIAPKLKNGIQIEFFDEVISKPYINMTVQMMRYFGAIVKWDRNTIYVEKGEYHPKNISIEADWSAASYWYSMVALSKEGNVTLYGLQQESLQGDAVVAEIYKDFGVETEFVENGIRLTKDSKFRVLSSELEIDFVNFPDIAQTFAVTCAALNVKAKLKGLKTLRIKETDRIAALQTELNKLGFNIEVEEDDLIINQSNMDTISNSPIKTYNDHRMAMAFAPLALIRGITIEDENVVAKSYPNFWEDLKCVGFCFN